MPIYALQREIGRDPRDFGVVADGVTDDSAAFAVLTAGHYMLSAATYKIGANCTVPVGVHLTMMPGAKFDIGTGFTLTINGAFDAPPLQVFDGAGAVQFTTDASFEKLNIVWFGAVADSGATDCYAAILSAISSLHDRGGTVYVPNGYGEYFGVSSHLMFTADNGYSNLTIEGEGRGSWIKHTADWTDGGVTKAVFGFTGENIYGSGDELFNLRVANLRISGNSASDLTQILLFGNVDGVVVDHLFFDENGREGIYFNSPRDTRNVWVTNCDGRNIGKAYFGGLSAINLNAINAHCHNNTLYDVGQGIEHTGYGLNVTGNNFSKVKVYGMLLMSTWSGWLDADSVEQNSQRAVIDGNIIDDGPVGILFGDAGGRTFSGHDFSGSLGKAIISNNAFVNVGNCINVGQDDDNICVIEGNLFDGSKSDQNSCIALGLGPSVVRGNTFKKGVTKWANLVKATVDEAHLITDNVVFGQCWTGTAFWIAGTAATISSNRILPFGDTLNAIFLLIGALDGFQSMSCGDSDCTVTKPVTYSGQQRSEWYGYAVPSKFTWKKSDTIENSDSDAAEYDRWRCTVAGTAGTLNSGATTGSITTGTAALTLSATTGLYPGAMITITGVTGTKTITALDYTTKIATLDSNADATVAAAAVAYKAPTFKTAGQIS